VSGLIGESRATAAGQSPGKKKWRTAAKEASEDLYRIVKKVA
jgi:hypothetical protein